MDRTGRDSVVTYLYRLVSLTLFGVILTGAFFSSGFIPAQMINSSSYGLESTKPAAPTLLDPENGTVFWKTWPSFNWSAVEEASNYTLQIAATADFDDAYLLVYQGLTDTAFSPEQNSTMQHLDKWYWRVQAVNRSGPGPYSETWVVLFSGAGPPTDGQIPPDQILLAITLIGIVVIASYIVIRRWNVFKISRWTTPLLSKMVVAYSLS